MEANAFFPLLLIHQSGSWKAFFRRVRHRKQALFSRERPLLMLALFKSSGPSADQGTVFIACGIYKEINE